MDHYSALLSVQRAYNLARRFPESTGTLLGAFARLVVEAGDKRWRRYAAREKAGASLESTGGEGSSTLDAPPALLLRLRAGFGGAKADLLSFLLGVEGAYVSMREAIEATTYTDVAGFQDAANRAARDEGEAWKRIPGGLRCLDPKCQRVGLHAFITKNTHPTI